MGVVLSSRSSVAAPACVSSHVRQPAGISEADGCRTLVVASARCWMPCSRSPARAAAAGVHPSAPGAWPTSRPRTTPRRPPASTGGRPPSRTAGWAASWWRGSSTATPGRWCRGWRRRWPSAPAPTGSRRPRSVGRPPRCSTAGRAASTRRRSSPGPSPARSAPDRHACSTASPVRRRPDSTPSARRVGPHFVARCRAPARVLLVDDVATTGATLAAAAQVRCAPRARATWWRSPRRARHLRDLPDTSLRIIPRTARARSPSGQMRGAHGDRRSRQEPHGAAPAAGPDPRQGREDRPLHPRRGSRGGRLLRGAHRAHRRPAALRDHRAPQATLREGARRGGGTGSLARPRTRQGGAPGRAHQGEARVTRRTRAMVTPTTARQPRPTTRTTRRRTRGLGS